MLIGLWCAWDALFGKPSESVGNLTMAGFSILAGTANYLLFTHKQYERD